MNLESAALLDFLLACGFSVDCGCSGIYSAQPIAALFAYNRVFIATSAMVKWAGTSVIDIRSYATTEFETGGIVKIGEHAYYLTSAYDAGYGRYIKKMYDTLSNLKAVEPEYAHICISININTIRLSVENALND